MFCGGISLFFDLTCAFDSVCRLTLFDHLRDLDTPMDLRNLLANWHSDTHYILTFQNQQIDVPVGRGVRQGCKIAPLLWVVYMDKFIRCLANKVSRKL